MYRPLPDYLTIKESSVHGLGLFTNEYIVDEIEIGITHVKNYKFEDGYIRTPLGGFINHSEDPNCEWIEENDMIVIGSNEKDMAVAANNLIKTQGGLIVVNDGKTLASLPLQMAGIISTDSFEKVSQNFADLNSILVESGCKFKKPHLIPLFLPFLALPSIRILYSGIVDVKNRSFIPAFN